MSSVIVIVGRPNVGKSTLFNRLSRTRGALVDDKPGITRDRLYASIRWGDTPLIIVDTGGYDDAVTESIQKDVKNQILRAIEEADRIIFMVDGRQGLLPGDQEVADILRRYRKKVYLAVNKIDGPEHDQLILDFYGMGIEKAYPISAAHGYGLKAFMNEIVEDMPRHTPDKEDRNLVRVAVLGRPNVGKSSLVNRILGYDRVLVSDTPGTTRDSVDTPFRWKSRQYLLIDTAGLRRKARVKEKIEKFSMIKALKSLDRCHIALILIDAEREVAEQDARICGYALERGRGVVLTVNKWDLIKNDPDKKKRLNNRLERQLKFISFAPRINLSALTGERVKKLFKIINLLYRQYTLRIGTGEVNRGLKEIIQRHPPPHAGRGSLKFLYATQTDTGPPSFVIFVNRPEIVHFSYERYLMNQIRERFGLNQTPIKLFFRKK
jgi:GTP-binding protein